MGAQLFEAVMAVRPASPLDFDKRIRAVHAFSAMDEAQALAAANKRIANILRKVEGDVPTQVNAALFAQAEESALFDRFNQLESGVQHAAATGDYTQVLKTLAQLRGEVDAFFEGVMVMAEDEAVKNNRLALLGRIGQAFMQVADISGL
jgi:glycyl-tRNA synthetase beta chain